MSETPTIHALDDATVRRIAAGEVVERPASVVKELIENSLDADASRVTVAVDGGGTDGVRVRDDGVGMTATDLERAVEEHTTSKISSGEDLAAVGTLGFRGEALHTIGAVSRLTIRSRARDGDRGHELAVEGGEVGDVRPSGCPPGTVVEVEDLFYNTPARQKFLKTETTEFDHVNRVVTQYALANPDVATTLEHDGREVFSTDGSGDLESAILAVYGREVASSMVQVSAAPDESPVDSVTGLVSHPETTRAGREYLSTFVNGRYVTAGTLRKAVLDAYGGQLAPDRYPFAVLFVDVPPAVVDVNVHPRKMEVRFDEEDAVTDAVRTAVREALLDEGLVRSSAPRGRSAPEETPITPESPEREVAGGESDDETAPTIDSAPDPTTDRSAAREADRDGRVESADTTTLDEVTSESAAAADASTAEPGDGADASEDTAAVSTDENGTDAGDTSGDGHGDEHGAEHDDEPTEEAPAMATDPVCGMDVDTGDPAATGDYAVPALRQVLDTGVPTFGICLGHQILALALGGRTEKMHLGHRGANHPVKDLATGKVEITSQNHGFKVLPESLPDDVRPSHQSLFDGSNEGLSVKDRPIFSVQYHPEASPGPHDSHYLFGRFIDLVERNKR